MKEQKDLRFLTGPLDSPKGFKHPGFVDAVVFLAIGFGLGMVCNLIINWGTKVC